MSEVSGGRPLAANPNAGALYPARPMLALVPFPLAMRIFPVLHWLLAGLGMIVLLGSLGVSGAGGWIGAVTYVFSGVGVSEVFYTNHHPGVALLPWILWAFLRASGGSRAAIAGLSVLLGLDLLNADVFTVGIAILACVLWALFEAERARWRSIGILVGATALAALLALPQVLATLLWIPQTDRAVGGLKLKEAVLYSISPWRLTELVIPYPFGPAWWSDAHMMWGGTVFHQKAMGLYATLYAGAFAVVALAITRAKREAGVRFARALASIALFCAVVPSLAPAGWGDLGSPVALRNPEKFAVALTFALALNAGIAADVLIRLRPRLIGLLPVGVLLTFGAMAAQAAPIGAGRLVVKGTGAPGPMAAVAGATLSGTLALAGLLWMATVVAVAMLRRDRGVPARLAALALLTIVPILANRRIAATFLEEDVFAPDPFARYQDRQDPQRQYRALSELFHIRPSAHDLEAEESDVASIGSARRTWFQFTHALWGRGTVLNGDFDAGDLSRSASLRRIATAAIAESPGTLLQALSLRFGVRYADQRALPGYHRVGGDALYAWDENDRALPSIRLLERWQEAPDAASAFSSLRRASPGEIVLETGASKSGSARPGILRVREDTPERLRVDVQTPDPAWLFVLRQFWEYRAVRLDGQSVKPVPAHLAYCAVAIPAGRHSIEWDEELPGFAASRWGPALFALAAVLLLLETRRRAVSR